MQKTEILLNNEWRKLWKEMQESSKIPHAILVSGEDGVGKGAFVHHCLASLSLNVLEDFSGNPNVILIKQDINKKTGKESDSISVERIREFKSIFFTTSVFGGLKAAIIKDAHLLNAASANALLKILEEPADGKIIFLITEFPELILATIRSRTAHFRLSVPGPEELHIGIKELFPDFEERLIRDAIAFGRGLPGKVFALLENESELKKMEKYKEWFDSWITEPALRWSIIDSIERKIDSAGISEILNAWEIFVSDLIKSGQNFGAVKKLAAAMQKARLYLKSNVQKKLILDFLAINS